MLTRKFYFKLNRSTIRGQFPEIPGTCFWILATWLQMTCRTMTRKVGVVVNHFISFRIPDVQITNLFYCMAKRKWTHSLCLCHCEQWLNRFFLSQRVNKVMVAHFQFVTKGKFPNNVWSRYTLNKLCEAFLCSKPSHSMRLHSTRNFKD